MGRRKRHVFISKAEKRDAWMYLGDLPAGRKGIVRWLSGGRSLTSRLTSMGFSLGVELEVVQNFGRAPIIVKVRDTRVAFGRGEATHIQVEAIND